VNTVREGALQDTWLSGGMALEWRTDGLRTRGRRWWYAMRKSASLQIGLAVLGLYALAALVGVVYTPYRPESTFVGQRFEVPSAAFWFGTDRLGQDVFSRTLAAAALDLRITVAAVLLSLAIGVTVGALIGYAGGALDFLVMRLLEIKAAFPGLIFALLIVAVIGPGELNVIIVLAFAGFPFYARLVRAELLTRKNWQYAEAARMVGCSPLRVTFRHLVPNSIGPALAYTSVNAASAVLTIASLGFLGVGLQPGTAEWGAMIARGQAQVITGQWWISFFPGLALLLLTAGFYLVGDGLRDVLDPRGQR
jgi:peptide/nickel transport system permease protein